MPDVKLTLSFPLHIRVCEESLILYISSTSFTNSDNIYYRGVRQINESRHLNEVIKRSYRMQLWRMPRFEHSH